MGALLLKLRRKPKLPADAPDPRADELRQRLDEARAAAGDREEFEAGETTVDQAEPTGGDLEERRRRVHESGRAAIDDLNAD